MKYIGSLLLLILVITLPLSAQQQDRDSVLRIVNLHTQDTAEVNSLIWLANADANTNLVSASAYFKRAIEVARKVSPKRSIVPIYHELGKLYIKYGIHDSARIFYRTSTTYLKGGDRYYADVYKGIALSFFRQFKFDSAKYYLKSAETVARKLNDHQNLTSIYNDWGNLYLQEGNYKEALQQYIQSAQLQDSLIHDPLGQATAYANIGNIQNIIGNPDKALLYTREAQSIAQKNDLKKVLAYTSQQLGRIYRKQKKLDEALIEYQKALKVYNRLGEKRNASETYASIGNIYFDKKEFKEAEKQYLIALQMAKSIKFQTHIGNIFIALSSTFKELKQFAKARQYVDSSLVIGKSVNDSYTVMDAYELLFLISKEQEHFKDALFYHEQFYGLKDSLAKVENKEALAEMELKYQNEKREAEIELLKSNQALHEVELARERANLVIVAIALISVVVISVLLVNRYRVLNRTRREMEMERMRTTIAQDLHDDIGSTLSSINIISKLALQQTDKSSETHFQRINEQSSKMMESISDIVWSINPNNDSLEQMVVKMKEFASEILEPKEIPYEFTGEEELLAVQLDLSKRKNLFLIFKEAINNAAKYSKAHQVKIHFSKDGSVLQLKISDDGIGFDTLSMKNGNGQRNLKERAAAVGGTLAVQSALGNGTIIAFTLPLP